MTANGVSRRGFRLRVATALLAALAFSAVAGLDADRSGIFTIKLHFEIDRSVQPRVIARDVQDEAESLWRPYGVHLEWTDARPSNDDANGYSIEAIVERRIGDRDVESPSVLGQASVGLDTAPRRPILVSFEATERVLALRRMADGPTFRIVLRRDISRALGRVLAHEIGHVLLLAPYHDIVGLMRPAFRPDELARPDRTPFRLTCTAVGRLRSRIRSLTSEPWSTAIAGDQVDAALASSDGEFEPTPCIPRALATNRRIEQWPNRRH